MSWFTSSRVLTERKKDGKETVDKDAKTWW